MASENTFNIQDCKVIDLFCGIGGLTHGFVKEGFNVVAGIDADSSCSYAYEKNNQSKFVHEDIRKVSPDKLEKLFDGASIKILAGCAPCQPFSQYSSKAATTNEDWELINTFAKYIEEVEPEIVSMENVPRLKNHQVFKNFIKRLENNGYHIYWESVYGPDYGLPQERERLLLLASKLGTISLVEKTHAPDDYVDVRTAIQDLPNLQAGEVDPNDRFHKCSSLSEINLLRIKNSKPGGTWHDWPPSLLAECHKKETGKGYVSVYGRMEWEKPSPTITTQFYGYGNGRFGHPTQNRALSLREGAILQTFPPNYIFTKPSEKVYTKVVGKHIGNAVPVVLGQVVARSISNHLKTVSGKHSTSNI